MTNTIDNTDDIIDSRDVIARIEELEGEREALQDNFDEAESAFDEVEAVYVDSVENQSDTAKQAAELDALAETRAEYDEALREWDADNGAELAALKALADEASGYAADWQYGEQLIRDSYFKEYALELADDIGAIDRNASWPMTCIDWDQAASELQMDYSAVDFDGVTYWIR